jgi:hypothetical protein
MEEATTARKEEWADRYASTFEFGKQEGKSKAYKITRK